MPMPGLTMRQQVKKRLQGLTPDQKIAEIDHIIKELKWDVGDYKDMKNELWRQQDAEKGVISIRHSTKSKYYIKKESPQSLIIGLPNSGKSTLLKSLTGSNPKIADYPFTTQEPELGSLTYNDVRIQMVELPPFYEGISTQNRELISLIRTTDTVVNVINEADELEILNRELEEGKIKLFNNKIERFERYSEDYTFIPGLIVYRDEIPKTDLETIDFKNYDRIKETLYQQFSITRIYSKDMKGNIGLPPITFMDVEEVNVEDVILRIDKRFKKKFKYAKVWGPSANFDGERVGLNRNLVDKDIITVYTKA